MAFSFPFIDQQLIQTGDVLTRTGTPADDYGLQNQTFTTVATVASRLLSPKGGKEFKKDKKASTQQWRVLVRPLLDGGGNSVITEHNWFRTLGKLLDITSVVEVRDFSGVLTALWLECEEVKP